MQKKEVDRLPVSADHQDLLSLISGFSLIDLSLNPLPDRESRILADWSRVETEFCEKPPG
jgi:hypothetical protein